MAITKKWIVVVLMMIGFLSSCQKPDVYEEHYVNSYTQSYSVKAGHWNVGEDDASGIYYYYEFPESKLTKYIFDNGVMQAFMLINGNLTPLPFDDFWVDGDYRWTEQVTCEFAPGLVTFILKYSDHTTDDPHYDYDFKVRFLW